MSYMTNSPSKAYGASDGEMELLKTYVLPAWIYRAFTAKYNLVEIHDYAKLRDVLSLTDVAHLELLRRHLVGLPDLSLTECFGPECVWEHYGQSIVPMSDTHRTEIASSLAYLLNDPQTQAEVLSRLKPIESECKDTVVAVNDPGDSEVKSYYRVVLLHGALYIIVEEGFLSHLQGKVERLAFLTEVLKSAYAIAPISVVNRSVWYRQYVMALPA